MIRIEVPRTYTGIGSCMTPPQTLLLMTELARRLARRNWTLRSGGADGADSAFEKGCDEVGGSKEIYLPWERRPLLREYGTVCFDALPLAVKEEAVKIAQRIHPVWDTCTRGAKIMHARNVCQVLGADLNTPTDVVIAWTPYGREVGGTRTALVLARERGIRSINLATWGVEGALESLEKVLL